MQSLAAPIDRGPSTTVPPRRTQASALALMSDTVAYINHCGGRPALLPRAWHIPDRVSSGGWWVAGYELDHSREYYQHSEDEPEEAVSAHQDLLKNRIAVSRTCLAGAYWDSISSSLKLRVLSPRRVLMVTRSPGFLRSRADR